MNNTDKRMLILQAASEVFQTSGFEKSTVQEIANKAGVGKGTIYEYFQSKEELFVQMIKNDASYVFDDTFDAFEQAETLEALLDNYIQRALYLIEKHSDKVRILFDDLAKVSQEVHDWFIERQRSGLEKLTALLKTFIKKNDLGDVDPQVLAWMILDIIRFGFIYKIIYEKNDVERIMQAQKDILLNGCRPQINLK